MSAELLGDDFRLYYDTAGNYSSPTWAEQKSVGSITFDPGIEQVEIPVRIGFKIYKKGRSDWTLGFEMNFDPTNTFHTAVRNAITNGTRLHLGLTWGDIASTAYWHAWWFLSGPLDASLDSNASVDVEGKIHFDTGTDFAEGPAFVTP